MMAVDVYWHLFGHIIYTYDVIDVEERIDRNQRILDLLEQEGQPPKVHLLIDFSSTDHGNYSYALSERLEHHKDNDELRESSKRLADNSLFGWVVSIGAQNQELTASANVMATKFKYRRRVVDTLEEAIEFLKKVDSNLSEKV
jgi:hypothetical protein